MDYCFFSNKQKTMRYAILLASFILGLLFLISFAYTVYAVICEVLAAGNSIAAVMLYGLLGLAPAVGSLASGGMLIWLGNRTFFLYSRKFSINAQGVTVMHQRNNCTTYSWKEIADICVCDVNHNYGGGFDTVIRFGLCTETNGPLNKQRKFSMNGHDKWRDEWYYLANYKKVIYIEYSQDRFETVLAIYPQIIDRRTKVGKKCTIPLWDNPKG